MRKHHLKPLSICAIALLTMGAACDKPSGDKDGDGKGTSNVGDDIEVVDGKVRFYERKGLLPEQGSGGPVGD